jgi:hypothetical protein
MKVRVLESNVMIMTFIPLVYGREVQVDALNDASVAPVYWTRLASADVDTELIQATWQQSLPAVCEGGNSRNGIAIAIKMINRRS